MDKFSESDFESSITVIRKAMGSTIIAFLSVTVPGGGGRGWGTGGRRYIIDIH